jgi:diaminopimelate decarboxylase
LNTAFTYRDDRLTVDDLDLSAIADRWGTPCYVYSGGLIRENYRALANAFGAHRGVVCYAVKANSTLAVLRLLAAEGSGFDIVSGGELERVRRAGGRMDRVVFSGACKLPAEIREALSAGVRCINVESVSELATINEVARDLGVTAKVALRVNPDVDGATHPYIATGLDEHKFGISLDRARSLARETLDLSNLRVTGIGCHIGSQLLDLAPLETASASLAALAGELTSAGIALEHIDVGGGLGIPQRGAAAPDPVDYAAAVTRPFADLDVEVVCEPGRSIVGPAGVLLTRVVYLKQRAGRAFALVDAGMNDLLRPALYAAWHDILPCHKNDGADETAYDVVGPVCETADFLGKGRSLALAQGDLLAVMDAGAYGFSMASNYNSRPRCAEILVTDGEATLARRRETIDDLLRGETAM